jgi:hypothetical protein
VGGGHNPGDEWHLGAAQHLEKGLQCRSLAWGEIKRPNSNMFQLEACGLCSQGSVGPPGAQVFTHVYQEPWGDMFYTSLPTFTHMYMIFTLTDRPRLAMV